jgi:glutamine---fructose-6-phosphate transaminase (isomerizing)
MSLHAEIMEQPEVLGRLLDTKMEEVEKISRLLKRKKIEFVFLAARGTSDNAGLYAKYLWGAFNGIPIALAAPSLFTIYKRPPKLKNSLVVVISQSGQSPDILGVAEEGRRQGAMVLSITNDISSPIAEVSDFVIDICAGIEKAVAATKTYTAQLLAIAMLSVALNPEASRLSVLKRLPDLAKEALSLDEITQKAADEYMTMEQCVVLGRGFNYATAYEWSLKLKELAYVVAEPYSSADFQHGPVAVVSRDFPVLAVIPEGAVFKDMLSLLSLLVNQRQVKLMVLSNQKEALSLANAAVRLPDELPEWLSPLISIIPAQLFCYHLTCRKGLDTETPRGLKKITLTK